MVMHTTNMRLAKSFKSVIDYRRKVKGGALATETANHPKGSLIMSREFIKKVEKVYIISALYTDFAHLTDAFEGTAKSLGELDEAEKIEAQASALREEGKRYLDIYFHYKEHVSEIENLDFDAITENLKEGVRALAQNF